MDVVMSSKKILPCKSDQGKLNQNETLMTFKDTYLLIANARLILLQLAICPDLLKALDAITILLEGYDIGFMNYRPEVCQYVCGNHGKVYIVHPSPRMFTTCRFLSVKVRYFCKYAYGNEICVVLSGQS